MPQDLVGRSLRPLITLAAILLLGGTPSFGQFGAPTIDPTDSPEKIAAELAEQKKSELTDDPMINRLLRLHQLDPKTLDLSAIQAFDTLLEVEGPKRAAMTTVQKLDSDKVLGDSLRDRTWRMPVIITDVIPLEGQPTERYRIKCYDRALADTRCFYGTINVALELSHEEATRLQKDQVYILTGVPQPQSVRDLPPEGKRGSIGQTLIVVSRQFLNVPQQPPVGVVFYGGPPPYVVELIVELKDVKLEPASKELAGAKPPIPGEKPTAGDSKPVLSEKQKTAMRDLLAFDERFTQLVPERVKMTNIQREESDKQLNDTLGDAVFRIPVRINEIEEDRSEKQQQLQLTVAASPAFHSDWSIRYKTSMPLSRSEALKLEKGKTYFLVGKPTIVSKDVSINAHLYSGVPVFVGVDKNGRPTGSEAYLLLKETHFEPYEE